MAEDRVEDTAIRINWGQVPTSCSPYAASMINVGILPGDIVAVRKQADARNGEIVVALVGDEEATVKRFFRERGRVRLQPENDHMDPMYPEEVAILGTVKAVLRRL